jgi:hypothetical protein
MYLLSRLGNVSFLIEFLLWDVACSVFLIGQIVAFLS